VKLEKRRVAADKFKYMCGSTLARNPLFRD